MLNECFILTHGKFSQYSLGDRKAEEDVLIVYKHDTVFLQSINEGKEDIFNFQRW